MRDCIFCKISSGDAKSFKIWEDDEHLAFLTPFPNTEGVTVVIPKSHQDSYVFNVDEEVMTKLMKASKQVAKMLDEKLKDVGRTAVVFEGYGVDHLHAKLFPMHGTADMKQWREIDSNINTYFEKYEGYISSHDADRVDDSELDKVVKILTE